MGVTYQIEWWNIAVSILIGAFSFCIASTSNSISTKIVSVCGLALSMGFITYYCLLGLWRGESNWTIFAWSIGMGIVFFISGIITIYNFKGSNDNKR